MIRGTTYPWLIILALLCGCGTYRAGERARLDVRTHEIAVQVARAEIEAAHNQRAAERGAEERRATRELLWRVVMGGGGIAAGGVVGGVGMKLRKAGVKA